MFSRFWRPSRRYKSHLSVRGSRVVACERFFRATALFSAFISVFCGGVGDGQPRRASSRARVRVAALARGPVSARFLPGACNVNTGCLKPRVCNAQMQKKH